MYSTTKLPPSLLFNFFEAFSFARSKILLCESLFLNASKNLSLTFCSQAVLTSRQTAASKSPANFVRHCQITFSHFFTLPISSRQFSVLNFLQEILEVFLFFLLFVLICSLFPLLVWVSEVT